MIRRRSLLAPLLALFVVASPVAAAPDSVGAPGENPSVGRFLLSGADPAEGMGVEAWPLAGLSFDEALYKFTTTTGIDLGDGEAAEIGEWILAMFGADGTYSQLLRADPSDPSRIILACGLEMDGTRNEDDARENVPLPLCNLEPDGRLSALLFRSALEPMAVGLSAEPAVEGRVLFTAAPDEHTIALDVVAILVSALLDVVAGSLIESCVAGGMASLLPPLLAGLYTSLGPLAMAIRQGDALAAGGEFLAIGDSLWTMLASGYLAAMVGNCGADQVIAAIGSDLVKRIAFGVKTAMVAAEGTAFAISLGARALSGQPPAEAEVAISARDASGDPVSRSLDLRTCASRYAGFDGISDLTPSRPAGTVRLDLPPAFKDTELVAHDGFSQTNSGGAEASGGMLLSPAGYTCAVDASDDVALVMLTRGDEGDLNPNGVRVALSGIYRIDDLCRDIPQLAEALTADVGPGMRAECQPGPNRAEEPVPGLYAWDDGSTMRAFAFNIPPTEGIGSWGYWFSCEPEPPFDRALCALIRDTYFSVPRATFELRPDAFD